MGVVMLLCLTSHSNASIPASQGKAPCGLVASSLGSSQRHRALAQTITGKGRGRREERGAGAARGSGRGRAPAARRGGGCPFAVIRVLDSLVSSYI